MKLKEILINLIGNVSKLTKEGFVRVSLKCENPSGKHFDLLVCVENSGIGIPKAKQAGMDEFLPKPVDIHQLYSTLVDLCVEG